MTFLWPSMLYFLVAVPLFGLLYLTIQRRRQRMMKNFGGWGLLRAESGRGMGIRRRIPPTLFLLSLAVMTFALARPQTEMSYPRIEGTVILVFDVSGSMLATDLQPTRLDAAKAAALDFVARQPEGVQIGIVAFSEGGLPVLAPTNDQKAIEDAINRLSPQRGTSLANGMTIAMNTILKDDKKPSNPSDQNATPGLIPDTGGSHPSAVIVLLTDGENNMTPDPLEVAQAAADQGIRIHTIGIGSPAGVDLEVNGFIVHTKLDEETLQTISQVTGGKYFNAQNETDLRTIYDNIEPQLVIKKETMEITSILAGVGFLILLLGGAFSMLWFNRMP